MNSIATYIFHALKSLIKSNSDSMKQKQNDDIVAGFTLNADVVASNKPNNADVPLNCCMINVNIPMFNTTKPNKDVSFKSDSVNDCSRKCEIIKKKNKKHDTFFSGLVSSEEDYRNNIASTFFDDISNLKPKK